MANLAMGMTGNEVKELQQKLTQAGFSTKGIDGIFGVNTWNALKAFQVAHKLPESGIVDAATDAILATLKKNEIPPQAVNLIKEFEGFYSHAYPDELSYHPITIGYGATKKMDGVTDWHLGETITQEEALELLAKQLERDYLPSLKLIPVWGDLNENQQSALISFGYNLGAAFFGKPGFHGITQFLKSKDWSPTLTMETFTRYDNPGTNVTAGLRRRRVAEAELFLKSV